MKDSPFISDEKEIMDALVKAHNIFNELKPTHPLHKKDFVDGVHKCQYVLIHRVMQRDYPKEFPIK